MNYPIFKQGDYNEELGTGQGVRVSEDGCALCCVASICAYLGKNTNPHILNQDLIAHNGYADNGVGSHTLMIWSTISLIYSDIELACNNDYPTEPASQGLIDAQLGKGMPVVVGVSFVHNPNSTIASHYVTLISKNDDGTYQCYDPYFGDITNFNTRYAVNGMSAMQCILQVVSYNGTAPQPETPAPAPAPVVPQPPVQPTTTQQPTTDQAQPPDVQQLVDDRNINWQVGNIIAEPTGMKLDPNNKLSSAVAIASYISNMATLILKKTQLYSDLDTRYNVQVELNAQQAATIKKQQAEADRLAIDNKTYADKYALLLAAEKKTTDTDLAIYDDYIALKQQLTKADGIIKTLYNYAELKIKETDWRKWTELVIFRAFSKSPKKPDVPTTAQQPSNTIPVNILPTGKSSWNILNYF